MAATRLIPLHENKGKTVSKCLKDRTDYAKNGEKTEDGKYVTAYNVKAVAKALLFLEQHDIWDIEDLRKRADESSGRFAELSATIKSAEKRMAEIAVLKTHILNYSKTRDIHVAYRKAGYIKRSLKHIVKRLACTKLQSRHSRILV